MGVGNGGPISDEKLHFATLPNRGVCLPKRNGRESLPVRVCWSDRRSFPQCKAEPRVRRVEATFTEGRMPQICPVIKMNNILMFG